MRLSLIGMSGSGKSYWTKKFAKHGFQPYPCDDLIKGKLSDQLIQPDGTMLSVGEWMGFPFDAGYKRREMRYLTFEKKVLYEVFDLFENGDTPPDGNAVIDTTGSVVYTGEDMLDRLRRLTAVVHLETPPKVQDKMLKAYLKNRRPVLWKDYFTKAPDETDEAAIARCYPMLMASRERLYTRHAHVTIRYDDHNNHRFSVGKFLGMVREQIAG
jgi:shikimate kinase